MLFRSVLVFVFVHVSVATLEDGERECNPLTEVPCDQAGCISRFQWCDSVPDCEDESDEMYCSNSEPCLEHHFQCRDGSCIPLSAQCDRYRNCKDGSDEICDWDNVSILDSLGGSHGTIDSAVIRAAKWILNQRKKDYSWGTNTPRAIIALSFADDLMHLPRAEKNLFIKELNVLLSLDIMRNRTSSNLSLSQLSLYINALYATCQEPLNFQGVDLISALRNQVDAAISKGDFNLPIALLTLCLAGKSTYNDVVTLNRIYQENEVKNGRTDAKAIALMAMSCISKLPRFSGYGDTYMKGTFENFRDMFGTVARNKDMDVYTKSLYLQATISMGFPVDGFSLLSHQKGDGSFGDLLATYHAIPVLMNSSLISLSNKCQSHNNENTFYGASPLESSEDASKMTYSIWIGSGIDMNKHSMEIRFSNKTLFDVMKMAEAKDPMFRFNVDDTKEGKKIYSLAGFPDDAEIGTFWNFYINRENVVLNSLNRENAEKRGLDRIYPMNGDHVIFWMSS